MKPPPIGEGSFGTGIYLLLLVCCEILLVYKGEYRGQEVAIKVLKFQDCGDKSLADFLREVETMENLRSPFIINFVGSSSLNIISDVYKALVEFLASCVL